MQQHIINADDSITVSHAITSYGGLLSSHLCYCGTYQQPLTTICWGGGRQLKSSSKWSWFAVLYSKFGIIKLLLTGALPPTWWEAGWLQLPGGPVHASGVGSWASAAWSAITPCNWTRLPAWEAALHNKVLQLNLYQCELTYSLADWLSVLL